MKNIEDARKLARNMVYLGKSVGRNTIAVLTDMSQPLGYAIGNRNEITEAVQTLKGGGRPAFRHFIAELAQLMLDLAGQEKSIPEILEHLDNGSAYAKFTAMVTAQGGDFTAFDNLTAPLKTKYQVQVKAPKSGYLSQADALKIGLLAMQLGAGRATKADSIDYEAGINLNKKIGDPVSTDEVLATLYSNQEIPSALTESFLAAIEISDQAASPKEILEVIR